MTPRLVGRPNADIRIYPSAAALTQAAAQFIVELGRAAISARGRFDWALAGGSTPRNVYRELAAQHAASLPWTQVHAFFGDERHVPPDHPDSNYRMVQESLLANHTLGLCVHRMEAERSAADAAARYEDELRRHFACPPPKQPSFDLVLLGMGTDGHTASLFPGTQALHERERAVVENVVPQLNTERITLTFPCLNAARNVVFLSAGQDKAAMLAQVLGQTRCEPPFPAQAITSLAGRPIWLVDEAAAQRLAAP